MAGMRDRGATAAVVELTTEGITDGASAGLEPNILIFTNSDHSAHTAGLYGGKQVSNMKDR